jgi:hypothetical protein
MGDPRFPQVEPGDPEQCQGIKGSKQCTNRAVPGTEMCEIHAANKQVIKAQEASKTLYRISRWQSRLNEFVDHEAVKSLRAEIGLARICLEEIVNKCSDSNDLIMYSPKIVDIITRIEKLVTSCHRIEESSGILLDRQAAMHLGTMIVGIIAEVVKDDDAISVIADKIVDAITSLQGKRDPV